jgi:hypothetical protein
VGLTTDDSRGTRLFVVPRSSVTIRAAATQLVGAAVCPSTCTVLIEATVRLKGRRGKAAPALRLTAKGGPAGVRLRLRTDAALRRRIQRARGATATITITYADASGATHRATAKLRLIPPGMRT